ncbi:MAG: chemotaxis protein CheA [Actinomycetia bacterium]|nr:chemotaxis protein CheA [Actinomycetes bacterium]MCP4961784.1 chemotaxis protein CheA [Actinomycetes bacterium]
MDEDDEIIGEFLVECSEGLDRLDQNLVELEETPDDREILTEAFRTLHTVKGSCGFLGFGQMEVVAHRGENLLSLLRDAVLEMSDEIADALLATVDAIRQITSTIDETGAEGVHDHSALIAELERLASAEAPSEAPADPAEPATGADTPDEPTAVGDEPAADAEVEQPEAIAPEPAAERIGDILVDDGEARRDDVEIAATEQSLGDDRKIGEILVEEGRAEGAAVEKAATKQRASRSDSSIRVDVELLDRVMNLVGELVLARNQMLQLTEGAKEKPLISAAQHLSHITSELQEGVMKTRMQPIGNVWSKLPRVVRDLSRQFGKQIRLEMEGKETELDKGIIEAIKDPLTHIVRNTVDHGIEMPDERVANGKDPEGVLKLRANHEGGQVVIEISDDGKGINADIIREKAISKGLISAEAGAEMSDKNVVNFIFAPGFSTAQAVSNVSGRGVGMDVVRTNVERIGGTVDVRTEAGQGTTFKIKIPLTLAIIPALIVSADGDRYAVPQVSLQELVRIEDEDEDHSIEMVHGAPVYRLRGRLLPVVDLRTNLSLEAGEPQGVTNIVVLHSDERLFGLIVDSIEDTEEIVVKPLERQIKDIDLFAGATIMGDGKVALILDVHGLAVASNLTGPGSTASWGLEDELDEGADYDERALLIVELADGSMVGLPLDQVDRLESFSPDRIERSDGRPVVQYRGAIMSLIDVGPSMGLSHGVLDGPEEANVVVCNQNGTLAGLAVGHIRDIVLDPEMHEEDGLVRAVVDGRVIDIAEPPRIMSMAGIGSDELIGAY